MQRTNVLRAALADLPPLGGKAANWSPIAEDEDGCIILPFPDYHAGIDGLFRRFRAGEFGFAKDDRAYSRGMDRFGTISALEREGAAAIARMDRQDCLLLLRVFDRQERFCDGARAAAHEQGFLHALLKRLIALEDS